MAATRRQRPAGWLALIGVLAALLLALPAAAASEYPKPTGHVTDAAGVMPAEAQAALETRLTTLEATTGIELAVATIPDLQGKIIEDYANGLYRAWGIGKRGKNNGVLLLVAPADRKVRIEVGYGLEGVITDALSSQIVRREVVPRFKAGDLPGGITAGADALISHLELPADQQAAALAAADKPGRERDGGNWFGTLIWIVIILVWIFLSVARGGRGRRRGPVILWGPGIGGNWGGGGGFGGFGGGGGGFGGFGGGSSGGGGASGSW
jgi:uncharacterized protein